MAVLYKLGNSEDEYSEVVAEYMRENASYFLLGEFSYIGIEKNGKLVGAIIFDNYNGHNIFMHAHAPRVVNRTVISLMFAYVFGQMKCVRMSTTQHELNDYAHNIVEKMGFVQECVLKNYYGKDVNAVQYYILPEMVDRKWDLKL